MTHYIDRIWLYSSFYGEQLRISLQLHEEGNSYAAFLLLFNVFELLCKSLKESDDGNVVSDVKWMLDNALITPEEEAFLNGQEGVRKIRNIMTHRNLYEYYFENDGIVYSFADSETWDIAYANYTPQIIEIMYNAIVNKRKEVLIRHKYNNHTEAYLLLYGCVSSAFRLKASLKSLFLDCPSECSGISRAFTSFHFIVSSSYSESYPQAILQTPQG